MPRTDRCPAESVPARDAVVGLYHAVLCLRMHPDEPQLLRTALRHCVHAVREVTARGPLVLGLHAGAVHVGEHALLPFASMDAPFGPLRHAGIGELVLQAGMPAAAIEELARRLATIDNGEADLAVLGAAAGVPFVQLRTATTSEVHLEPASLNWSLAPPPGNRAAALRARIERELGANLTALAARQLLEHGAACAAGIDDMLATLFARMLRDDDLQSAAWLLGEVANHEHLPPAAAQRLTALAQAHGNDRWLTQRLHGATRDELLQLSAFVMQLGDDAAQRFAAAARSSGHPLSQWLCELLGQCD